MDQSQLEYQYRNGGMGGWESGGGRVGGWEGGGGRVGGWEGGEVGYILPQHHIQTHQQMHQPIARFRRR